MTPDLKQLQELLAKATPGKWVVRDCLIGEACWCRLIDVEGSTDGLMEPFVAGSGCVSKADAALIVAMHEALPALLASHEALSARVAGLKSALGEREDELLALKAAMQMRMEEHQRQSRNGCIASPDQESHEFAALSIETLLGGDVQAAEVAGLREDKARLDWLERTQGSACEELGSWGVTNMDREQVAARREAEETLASQAAKIEAVRAIAKNMRHYQSCASIFFETLKQPCDCNVGLLKDALAALES